MVLLGRFIFLEEKNKTSDGRSGWNCFLILATFFGMPFLSPFSIAFLLMFLISCFFICRASLFYGDHLFLFVIRRVLLSFRAKHILSHFVIQFTDNQLLYFSRLLEWVWWKQLRKNKSSLYSRLNAPYWITRPGGDDVIFKNWVDESNLVSNPFFFQFYISVAVGTYTP